MATTWTPERRARQAAAIQNWSPWKSSTGPKTRDGKSIVARNAYRGGERAAIRSEAKKVNAFLRLQRTLLDDLLRGAK